ncbi:hypothetical protein SASPL_155612 [Salvia splendens]|uniref:Cytochrome P450 n=1 Tax=Salvia splendens TaxID=180675 RepID=A0A8X8YY89_SALSN|nr:hypothetical protein SASPL_155612 [Salvia splendens]
MKRLDSAFEKLDSFYQELIDEHLRGEGVDDDDEDILGMQITLELNSDKPTNWDRVKALLMNLFLGGTDSTAASIVWIMTALMKAPHIMKKVQTEIRNVVGNNRKVDEDDLPKLPYLKAVMNETFRFYTPLPMLAPRETTKKFDTDVLPGLIMHKKNPLLLMPKLYRS